MKFFYKQNKKIELKYLIDFKKFISKNLKFYKLLKNVNPNKFEISSLFLISK